MGSREGETTNGKVEAVAPRPEIDRLASDASDASTPKAAPTRRTLTFPASEVWRRSSPRRRDDDVGGSPLFASEAPEAALLRALGVQESSGELASGADSARAADVGSERPSERSTVPTLASKGVVSDSSSRMIELSASELESVRELAAETREPAFTRETLAAPPLPRLELATLAAPPLLPRLDLDEVAAPLDAKPAQAITERPPPSDAPPSKRKRDARRAGLFASHALVAVAVAVVAGSGAPPSPSPIVREPNVALSERTPLASPAIAAEPSPPSGGCAASGDARVLAPRAQIGPGLDVTVLETGFGVALASGRTEAVGLRVEGSGLRVAETVRVKSPSLVSHAVVESGREDDADSLDVRVDEGEVRTVAGGGDAPAFRVVARGGSIMALLDDLRGVRVRNIWPLPGGVHVETARVAAPRAAAPAGPAVRAPAATVAAKSASPYRPSGVAKAVEAPRPPARVFVQAPEVVRAAARDDGGAVIALRRPSMFYLGVTDASLAPAGPLVSLTRKGATVGTPSVAPWGGGGAVAWAERAAGEREWSIVVAGFTPDGEGATTLGPVRVIGKGMSPTLAALPDGDLLLAHADGPAGAHRVVAVRLGRDLEPRGEPLVVSPDSINAGQPALAVRPDGRAIVAFFAADRGRAASVFATPLACDPGF
ncbi:MAG: hypothetical protein KF795_06325 [Labilithrix sp.]|nr:hypothetical protein [Labilithrix sp.]